MVLHIDRHDPQPRQIATAADTLQRGGVIIYPTDTIYGLGCDIFKPEAIEAVCRLKNIQPDRARLSFICFDLSDLSIYARQLSNTTFRLLKEYLPGPYTFILPASKQVPKILQNKKDTIGLRVPDNRIARAIVKQLGHPILSTSLPGDIAPEYADPEMIHRNFEKKVDLIIDGGIGGLVPSTIIDCTGPSPVLIRQGLGEWET